MLTDFAETALSVMDPEAAVYTRGTETFDLEVAVQECDKAFRVSKRDRVIDSEASGVCLTDTRLARGGRLTIGSREYRIDRITPSPVPGLSDLSLTRIAGDAVPVFDVSDLAPLDETVILNGIEVSANVNRSVEIEEVARNGSRIVVARTIVAIAESDTNGAGTGSVLVIDGETKTASRAMNDGVGLVKFLV